MASFLKRLANKLFREATSAQSAGKLIQSIAYQKGFSPKESIGLLYDSYSLSDEEILKIAYQRIGILNYENDFVSGEHFLIHQVLPKYLSGVERPILFDVGANVGNYSEMLATVFPKALVFAFEPNPTTFKALQSKNLPQITKVNVGLGSETKTCQIYTYANDAQSEHASIHKDVFGSMHGNGDVIAIDFQLDTLDNFCHNNQIGKIDFLKIDTEGNELDCLQGSKNMLASSKINVIQFEFNEMNVISRVFLKDFYDLLPDYQLFRLHSTSLTPLSTYSSMNEIFKFQNIVAIHSSLVK